MAFESVKQNGPVWQPTHTGTKKGQNLQHLTANDKSFIDGFYLGCETGQGPESNSTIHKMKVKAVGDKSLIVGEREPGNDEVSIWGTTVLNDNLSKISIGDMIRIQWEGKKMPKKGGNEYHSWDVLVDRTVEKYTGAGTNIAAVGDTESEASATVMDTTTETDDDLPF